jgi:hypothetical protein
MLRLERHKCISVGRLYLHSTLNELDDSLHISAVCSMDLPALCSDFDPLQFSVYFIYLQVESSPKIIHSCASTKPNSKFFYERQSVGQSAFVLGTHLWPTTRFLWLSRVCWYGMPYLMRGLVCSLKLLLVLTSELIFGFKSSITQETETSSFCWAHWIDSTRRQRQNPVSETSCF